MKMSASELVMFSGDTVTLTVPDETYFKVSEVTPFIIDGKLYVYDGYGTKRSWGKPSVKTIVKMTEGLIICDVVGWHKHTTCGPVKGTFYFVCIKGQWERKRANHSAVKALIAVD